MAIAQNERKRPRPRRTFTMGDEVFERLTLLADDADTSRSRLLEQLVGQDHEAYERLTQVATGAEVGLESSSWSALVFLQSTIRMNKLTTMAQRARANEAQFLEHLILRAEAIYNFQPPVLPSPRPWWKLWSKEEREPELPAIVADLRNAA